MPTATAHTGTTHAGTPHWVLLAFVGLGLAVIVATGSALRRGFVAERVGVFALLFGILLGGFGGIGLVELQVVSSVGPKLNQWYPLASIIVGCLMMLGSLAFGRVYYPDQPRYAVLGALLGMWIVYPAVLPNEGVANSLGYLLVAALPLLVGRILWKDAGRAIHDTLSRRRPKVIGLTVTVLIGVFLSFSAGTLSLNPDSGVNKPTEQFVAFMNVGNPLVLWPAIEFFLPSIPLTGMVSVGTALLFGLLAGLVGLNVSMVTHQWNAGTDAASSTSMLGALATTGATACCCCAPAAYGVISALLGATASPVYWAFMDTSSPLGTLFLGASVLLLTGSIVQTANASSVDESCEVVPSA